MKKNEPVGSITNAGKIEERIKAQQVLEKAKKTQGKTTLLRQGESKDFIPKNKT